MRVGGGGACGGVDAGEFVGEDRDAYARAACEEAAGFGCGVGGSGAYAVADLGGDGVVLVGAEVFDVDVEGAEVGD